MSNHQEKKKLCHFFHSLSNNFDGCYFFLMVALIIFQHWLISVKFKFHYYLILFDHCVCMCVDRWPADRVFIQRYFTLFGINREERNHINCFEIKILRILREETVESHKNNNRPIPSIAEQ